MSFAFLEPFSGVSGDMFVAALCDLGVDVVVLQAAVASLGLPGVAVTTAPVSRAGITATRFLVQVEPPAGEAHRGLAELIATVDRAAVSASVRGRAVAVFERLARAEAKVHGVPIERVHFHEIGAEDTVVDVLCACLGIELLGIQRICAGVVATGSGSLHCAHGELPVPAPATLELLRGVPITAGRAPGERTTPTGAALLAEFVDEFEIDELVWTPDRSGYGAGERDDPGWPNVLRATLGRCQPTGAAACLSAVSCNLDTVTGEGLAHLIEGALALGAADAFALPIVMKKGRPAHQLSVLVDAASRDRIIEFLLEESTSLGVRDHTVDRQVLERWCEQLDTQWGAVTCKVTRLPSGRLVRRPEDDEVSRLVSEFGLSRRFVVAELGRLLGGP